jgi:hypothetical protein
MAVCVAYSLAVQAVVASVGLGMSAAAASDFILCSFVSDQTAGAPVRDDDRQKPSPMPRCPFCVIATQTAGDLAIAREVPTFPTYASLLIGAISQPIGDGTFVSESHHRNGEARAPPAFSV